MKRLAVVAALIAFATPSLAAESASSSSDPMKGWNPPKVKNEKADRSEIMALMKKLDDAGKKGDLEAAMALIDFPVLMTTDNSKGEAMSATWDAERYRKEMEPFYKPMTGTKVKHKPTVFLVTDSLATVDDVTTVTTGNKTITARNSTLLVRTGGQWKIKSMTEGGWGDMMGEHPSSGATKSSARESDMSGTSPSSTGSSATGGTTDTGSTTETRSSTSETTTSTTDQSAGKPSSPGTGPTGTGSTSGTGGAAEPAPTTPPPAR